MKRKIWMLALIMISLVGTCYHPIAVSSDLMETSDVIYAEDVHVLVIGRCRTIGSDGTWHGGLFIGGQAYPGCETRGEPLERFRVIVYNESILHPWMTFTGLTRAIVFMHNASGVFFWGRKGSGFNILPPVVFVSCYTEKLWISIFDET